MIGYCHTTTAQDLSDRGLDTNKPNVARMHNALIRDHYNFAADRDLADRALLAYPGLDNALIEHCRFVMRIVDHLARAGIRQFLDLGSGIISTGAVHELAQAVHPECRVLYADFDQVVVAHIDLMLNRLRATANAGVLGSDASLPDEVFTSVRQRGLLDLDQPVAVLMLGLVHFMPDRRDPAAVVARYRDLLAPGSYLAVSHITDDARAAEVRALEQVYTESDCTLSARPTRWIAGLLGDFVLVKPGIVPIPAWRPDPGLAGIPNLDTAQGPRIVGGLGQKPMMEKAQ